MIINTAIAGNPLNWLIVFFMLLIPCIGIELILDRRENGCGCSNLLTKKESK